MPASYSIGAHFKAFVQRQVGTGRFASASEVVREGLRLMEEREAEREARLEALRAEIARGRDSGPGIPADEVFARVQARIDEVAREPAGRSSLRKRASPSRTKRSRREDVLKRLRAHEPELREMGIKRLSLFGSVARAEAGAESDIDLAAELDHARGIDLLDFAQINLRLSELLGAEVDLVSEPARKPGFQAEIDRDRVDAF